MIGRDEAVEEPDPVLIRAAAAGDVEAFTRLVRRYQEPVWRFLSSLVSDRALAEDLAQETFLRAFRRLDTFGFRSRFSTWLFQIARNQAVDALRARERQRVLPFRVGPATTPPDPDLGTELGTAVASLSPKLREALLLVEVMGFTCREAGDILEIPDGTVKSRLFHARRHLVAWFDAGADGWVHGEV